jgi:hypothetical protein
MDRDRVLDALATLRGELVGAKGLSPEARAALERVSDDIRQHLEEREAVGSDDDDAASALKDSLLEFEAEHPQLTGAINQVAAALANLGI